jgi:hypothetical protein
VALAQTLPTGTAMGFSVRYFFVFGDPQPSAKYLWVIEPPGGGKPHELQVTIKRDGTLQTFVPQWGANTGVYKSYIVEVTRYGRKAISKKIDMPYNY